MSDSKMSNTPNPPIHGYSGKPLYQKLGLKPSMTCLLMNAPDHYPELVEGVQGVRFLKRAELADVVHIFCPNRKNLTTKIQGALSKVKPGGMLWVSWPKKSSPLFLDLTEGQLRDVILPLNWVDVKVCAVDQNWSGLKFLKRKS